MRTLTILAAALTLAACKQPETKTEPGPLDPRFANDPIIQIVKDLSTDEMGGRALNTPGGEKARNYIIAKRDAMDVFDTTREHAFEFERRGKENSGTNIIGTINGETPGEGPLLVITAHYDHVGERKGKIYNGADDNASGVAALFAIAKDFKDTPPKHDVEIVWLDAEESGLRGARAIVKDKEQYKGRAALNMNLDMISQNQENTIFMAGSHHTPALKPLMEQAADGVGINLKFGHDKPEDGLDDWTLQSDHGIFHRAGFPFVYFGVEDHPHYHKHTDEFETLPLGFYQRSVKLTVNAARILDENLETLAKPAKSEDP